MNEINQESTITINEENQSTLADTSKRVIVRPGLITRYSTPVSKEELDKTVPPTKRGNRRAWSFMNTANLLPGGFQTSLEQWRLIALDEKKRKSKELHGPQYDVVPKPAEPIHDAKEETSVKYEAVLFATDSDFLEQAQIRLFFKSNALNEEEAKLFEMPAVVQKTSSDAELDNEEQEQVSNRCCQFLVFQFIV
jgi:hypothetical protein